RFQKAPRLILMVVTIGLAQLLAGLGVALPYLLQLITGGTDLAMQQYTPPFDFSFEINPVIFHANELIAVITTVLAVVGLFAIFLASCGLGAVEAIVVWNKGSGELVDPIMFVIVIGALLLQRRHRESRVEDQAISSWQNSANIRPIPRELMRLPEVKWTLRG